MSKKNTWVKKLYKAFSESTWTSGMNHTREKNYHIWSAFWSLLISAGVRFEESDLIDLDAWCDEGHYSLAGRNGNLSFAYAYESVHKRTPFVGIGLSYDQCYPSFSNHATQAKSAGRLVMHTRFTWQGEKVKVTSFNDKESSLIACAYHPRKDDDYSDKIKKRFKITAKDFRKEMSARKKTNKLSDELESKGIKIKYHQGFGYYIIVKLKTKSKYYDTTGEVVAGLNLEGYKPFKEFKNAVEFAETIS